MSMSVSARETQGSGDPHLTFRDGRQEAERRRSTAASPSAEFWDQISASRRASGL
jgi:hypothetical protein